ncbi:MAG TPA: nitrile hydratase [Chloroflexota bacterium]|nr:nitrile hydratase [Chloroflexota bacterium]
MTPPENRRPNDRGGWPGAGPIDRSEHEPTFWERRVDAMQQLLGRKGIAVTDENRAARERTISLQDYEQMRYYDRWLIGMQTVLVGKGILAEGELERKVAEMEARSSG